jgi:DNA-directed RNA polymerase subunit RPC12/RpoP
MNQCHNCKSFLQQVNKLEKIGCKYCVYFYVNKWQPKEYKLDEIEEASARVRKNCSPQMYLNKTVLWINNNRIKLSRSINKTLQKSESKIYKTLQKLDLFDDQNLNGLLFEYYVTIQEVNSITKIRIQKSKKQLPTKFNMLDNIINEFGIKWKPSRNNFRLQSLFIS